MKEFFQKNKKIILLSGGIISILLLVLLIVLFIIPKKKITKNTLNEDYIMYVNIGPIVELEYTVECEVSYDKDNNIQNENCNDPFVTSYELINEEANNIYETTNLIKDQNNIQRVINQIINTATKNNIYLDSIEIYTDWQNASKYFNNVEKNNEYKIIIANKTTLESKFADEKWISKEFEVEGIDIKNIDEDYSYTDLDKVKIKVTVKGTKDNLKKINKEKIKLYIDVNKAVKGNNNIKIEVANPNSKVKYYLTPDHIEVNVSKKE